MPVISKSRNVDGRETRVDWGSKTDWWLLLKMDAVATKKEPNKSLINTRRLGSDGEDASTWSPYLRAALRTAGGERRGVRLCFICCPLRGGFNLQLTHESVLLKLPFEL